MKNKNDNHSHFISYPSKWGIDFGQIRSTHPLNCRCGSRNIEYQKKKAELWAKCSDCGGKFQVYPALSPYLQHLLGEVKP